MEVCEIGDVPMLLLSIQDRRYEIEFKTRPRSMNDNRDEIWSLVTETIGSDQTGRKTRERYFARPLYLAEFCTSETFSLVNNWVESRFGWGNRPAGIGVEMAKELGPFRFGIGENIEVKFGRV